MACEQFIVTRFSAKTRGMIAVILEVIEQIEAMGYTLTLRQLYYQLVSRDIIPNRFSEYKKLGETVSHARLSGLIDWNSIEDRTRNIKGIGHHDNPAQIIKTAASAFRIDKWASQDHRIEVWVEKDALVGVIERACAELDVKWFSCRGYTSQSEVYEASKRILDYIGNDKEPVIIHLGDHDPSGIDMSRDIIDRLTMFCGREINIERIALNIDQVEQYNPPPNYAKPTDSRYEAYKDEFGEDCWELDALNPKVIGDLIQEKIKSYRNDAQWDEEVTRENLHRETILKAANRWPEVEKALNKKPRTKKPKKK